MNMAVIDALCRDFLAHLQSELIHLEAHEKTLRRERRAILDRDLDTIQDCLKEKEMLQMQGRILEVSRKRLQTRIKDDYGFDETSGTSPVHWLIDRSEEPMKADLAGMKNRIEERLRDVNMLSEGNDFMFRAALGRINQSLGFLRQFQGAVTTMTYDGGGRIRTGILAEKQLRQQV